MRAKVRPRRLLPLILLAAAVRGDSYPPGDYSDTGRVVRTARGQIVLFNGWGCTLMLPEELQKVLAPHVGELVRVDYTRVEETEGALWDSSGAPIGRIRGVTKLPNDVRITVRPEKPRFLIAEPVRVQVTLENTGDQPVELRFSFGTCSLLTDYHNVRSLEPEGREVDLTTRALGPGEFVRFTIESAWMVKAGQYDVAYAMPRSDEVYLPSDPVRVEVFGEETADVLRVWLTRASPTQRIEIAERLLLLGDRAGVAVVLKLLDAPEGIHGPARIYRFLWKHGGVDAETRLLEVLSCCWNQASAQAIIEEVPRAPRAIALLERLLQDRRETWADISGWCERPRVCDITAGLLSGYTDGAMTFPDDGTVAQRDAAVATVLKTLRESPHRFSVLK